MEDLLYEAESVRRLCGLTLTEAIPDESTILHFRHLLERHDLGTKLFETINAHLARRGLRLCEGTIVDASIIEAPSSKRDGRANEAPALPQPPPLPLRVLLVQYNLPGSNRRRQPTCSEDS